MKHILHPFTIFFTFLLFSPLFRLSAQDPFFTHFNGNEPLFNPALTGFRGALSIGFKVKSQWQSSGIPGYETYLLTLEESMPCSFFDYGFSVMQDREGQGLLHTQQFGGMLAAPLSLMGPWRENRLQLRIGIGAHWGRQYIDYSKLTFIDQIDPKYGWRGADGQPIPTAFLAPNDGYSNWYFQPSGGISLRFVQDPQSKYAKNYFLGFAVHNLLPLVGANEQGHSWSLLGLGTPTKPRYTAFARLQMNVGDFGKDFLSIHPQVFWQSQQKLSYLELGADFSFSNRFSVGGFVHTSKPNEDQPSTNWGSAQAALGFFTGPRSRADVGFSYSFNFSGLRNHINNIYEVTLRLSFASSPICTWTGNPPSYDSKERAMPCRFLRESSGKNKIYENIWYRNN